VGGVVGFLGVGGGWWGDISLVRFCCASFFGPPCQRKKINHKKINKIKIKREWVLNKVRDAREGQCCSFWPRNQGERIVLAIFNNSAALGS
jgi:hypothetical protein